MRILADENLHFEIVQGLRREHHEVFFVPEIGLAGQSDSIILDYAEKKKLIVISGDKDFVGITDYDWCRFLSAQDGIDEVNYWQPSENQSFRAINPGEPFLFKRHHPRNFIVGGGFFVHFSILPVSLAWASFQEKNGASFLPEMRKRIEQYRRIQPLPSDDLMLFLFWTYVQKNDDEDKKPNGP